MLHRSQKPFIDLTLRSKPSSANTLAWASDCCHLRGSRTGDRGAELWGRIRQAQRHRLRSGAERSDGGHLDAIGAAVGGSAGGDHDHAGEFCHSSMSLGVSPCSAPTASAAVSVSASGSSRCSALRAKRSADHVLPHHRTPSISTAPRRESASAMSASATRNRYCGNGCSAIGDRGPSCRSASGAGLIHRST